MPLSPATTATFSVAGTYVLRLTADDTALTAFADTTITVNAALPVNQAPQVTSGGNQTITLPAGATLSGSVTDDGLPANAAVTSTWTQQSGPGTATFANAASPATTATFSVAGTYVLRLTADDTALSAFADATITVNAALPVNQAPQVTSGGNQTITLPAGATLNGTVTDDGLPLNAAVTSTWTQQSGPGTATFANAASAATTATFSVAGTYVLRLTADDTALTAFADTTITVNAALPVNQAPQVTSGGNQTITLPAGATLNGTVTDDGLPLNAAVTSLWTQQSGPGTATFANALSPATTATFSVAGTYVLRLTADDTALSAFADATITVNAALPVNQAPQVTSGGNQTITLPAGATLSGTVTDDGLPLNAAVTSTWTQQSGPGTATFANPASPATTATFSVAGTYVLRLTADDTALSAFADAAITVNLSSPGNLAPKVTGGDPQFIGLPAAATLSGAVTDDGLPAGAAVTTTWTKVSGPGAVEFGDPFAPVTTATFGSAGTYVLRLSATDTAMSGAAETTVVATAAPTVNSAPTVSASASSPVLLPSLATLEGRVADDGLPAGSGLGQSWAKVSGPGTVTFDDPTALSTRAEFGQPGTYVLRLTATDTQQTSSAELQVVVTPPPALTNGEPAVNVTVSSPVVLPSVAALSAQTLDDGLPTGSTVSGSWSKVSGPGSVSFAAVGEPNTTATFGQPGSYVLRFTATDSDKTGTGDGTIVVNPAPPVNQAPVVLAGDDVSLILPSPAALRGTATDDGLPTSTLSAAWQKVSGPGEVTFSPAQGLQSSVSFSQPGAYILRLVVSDGDKSGSDDLAVTTTAPTITNAAPTVDAGSDQQIALGGAAVLTGSIADDGQPGTPLVIAWQKVSGPGTVAFTTPQASSTQATFTAGGVYVLSLTASDGQFASSDDVAVTVRESAGTVDRSPPVITLHLPTSALPGAVVRVEAQASDDTALSQVLLEIDGQSPIVLTSAPFFTEFTTPQFAAPGQDIRVRATATDASQNSSQAQATLAITATPDTTAPSVTLSAPAVVAPGKPLRLVARASDDTGVDKIAFSINGVDLVTDAEAPYEISYLVPADAPVGVPISARARALDFAGNSAEGSASVDVVATVVPVAPQITLTVPATASPGDMLTLTADATDLDGVADVVFTQGLAVLAADDAPPFSATYNVPVGTTPGTTIAFTAEATDLTDTKASDTKSVTIQAAPTLTRGVITGEVYDDTTSVPIANAVVALTGVDRTGVPYAETAETDSRGRFLIRAVGGAGVLQIQKDGWTRVDRRITIVGGQATAMFDARLTRLGPSSQALSFATGGSLTSGESTATFAPGTVPATAVRFTAVTQQGLEGLLPTGWTPIAVFDVWPHDVAFNGAVSFSIRRLAGSAAVAPLLARWDESASAWRTAGPGQVTADGRFLQASVGTSGHFAFVLPDLVPVAPPAPSGGGVLTGVGDVQLPVTVTTLIEPAPRVLFYQPGAGSDVRSAITPQAAVSSGAAIAARLSESYRFRSGPTAAPEPMTEDLVAFQDGTGDVPPLVASARVTPSLTFEALTLEQGVIAVEVVSGAAGNVAQIATPSGGEFTAPTGQALALPPGAVSDGAVVSISALSVADFGVVLPSGIAFLGGASISTTEALARAGVFSIPAPAGLANLGRVLLVRTQEIRGQTRAVLVGVATLSGERLVSDTTIGGRPTALEGVRQGGRYAFIQADGPIGFAGGLVTGIGSQPAPGALVASDTFFAVSLSNAVGAYLAAAPANTVVLTATDLVRNDYGSAAAFLLQGGVLPLPLAMGPQPPRVTSISPVDGSTNVPLAGPIVVRFSEPVDPGTIGPDVVSLSGPGGTPLDIVRALSQGNTVLTVRTAAPLTPDAHYTFALTTGVKDLSGNGLTQALSMSFDSADTRAPLPPPAGALTASIPNAQGFSTVAGSQGTAGPRDQVFIDNLTTHTSAVALVQANGGFSTLIAARAADTLQIRIVDAAGNETKSPLPAFKTVNADGSVSQAVNAAGGTVEGPNGSQAKVKPGTFPNGAVVTINYVAPADFPIQLAPEFANDYAIDGGIKVDFGGQTPQLYIDLSIPPRGGETDATRWIVVASEEVNGELMMNAIDTAKFRGDRITTASPPCPGVQAERTYGFVRSRQTVGLSYSNVFVGVGKGLLMGLKWQFTGGPFGLMPFGVHADPFAEAMCYPVLTGNVTLVQNAVRVSIPARLLTPADRQLILKNLSLSLPANRVPRDVKEFTLDVDGETSDSFRIEAKGSEPTEAGASASLLLTKFTISTLAPGRVRLRIDPDPVNIAVASIDVRNLTRDTLSTFNQSLADPFTAAGTGGNGDQFEVTIVDVLGRSRKLEQQYQGTDSMYGDGNLVLKAVEASIDPTREEMNAAGVGGKARTSVTISDLTQLGVFQPVPAARIVRGGIKGLAFRGDPTHDFAIIVSYDDGSDYTQRLPRMQIDVRDAATGKVLKTIDAFAPPPDEPQGLPDITDGDTRAPYVITGPSRLSNFDPSGQLVFTFSEAMDPDSLKSAFEVKDSAGRLLEGVVEVSGGDRIARFVPAAAFRAGEQYTVRIKGYSPAQGPNPGAGGGAANAARDRRGNPVAELALIIKVFTPKLLDSFSGDGDFGIFKDVVVPPPAPIVVDPNPNQPGPGSDPTDQDTNRSRPVYVTTSHQTFNLLSVESRDPRHLFLLAQKEGPISRQQGTFIRNVAFTKSGPSGSGVFSGDLLLTTTFNINSSRLDWYDVTRRNNLDTFDLLSSKVLTENPDLAGFGNRNNTIFAEGALAKGLGVLSGATGVTGYVAVERVGVLATSLSQNTPYRSQSARIKEDVYPGDFLDLAVADGKIFAISRTEKQLHVLDAGLGALAVRPLQLNGKSYTPRKIKVRTDIQIDRDHDGFLTPEETFSYAFIAADQAVLMVDITDSSAPQVTGVIPLPGIVRDIDVDVDRRRAFVTANGALVTKMVNGVATQVDGYVAMLDIADPTIASTIDVNQDGLDDRVTWQEGASGVNGVRIDPFRGVLFVAGSTLDTYAVYDLCCDLGVDLAPKPTASVTGDRLTLAKLEKQAVANGLALGIGKAVAECGIQASAIKLLDLGSGSCIWKGTDSCGSDYKPGLGTHDIAVFVSHAGLLVNAPGQDSGGTCTVKKLANEFVSLDTGLHKEIDVDGAKVKIETITFAAYHLSELEERAQYNIQSRDATLPGQIAPDFGLGRQGLLMSHVLGGSWVNFVPGYGAAFAGPSLNAVMEKLRTSRYLPIVEGHEQTRLANYLMAQGKVYIRFQGASSATSQLNSLYQSQITAAATAGIKAAFGRLIVDVHGRDRLLAVSLDPVTPVKADSPVRLFGENACLASDPALAPAEWKEVGCTSFDHFVASQAAGTRRSWGSHPALDGSKPDRPELFTLDRAVQVLRFYRIGAGFESIQSEADADDFIAQVHDFVNWADDITKPFYDNRVNDDPQAVQRVQNRIEANGGITKELTQASVPLAPRIFNKGFGPADGIALDMYVTRPGETTKALPDTSVTVSVDGGTSTFVEFRRNPDGTLFKDSSGKAQSQFSLEGLRQRDAVGVLGWVAFAIDVPQKKQKEADRQNNIGGTFFYMLDVAPSAVAPSGGARVPSPVGDAVLAGDADCDPDPAILITQGLRIGADGTLLASPVRLEVDQVANLEVSAQNTGNVGSSVTICNTLNGQCQSLGTIGSQGSGQASIRIPTEVPATYDIITTSISPVAGILRQSPFRVSISCTPYAFLSLSHDPSAPSTVMRQGTTYRHFQLVNKLTGKPVTGLPIRVNVSGARVGTATVTTDPNGIVGSYADGAFREGVAIPYGFASGGSEGAAEVVLTLDRGDSTECAVQVKYSINFVGFSATQTMSAGAAIDIKAKFLGKFEGEAEAGLSFSATRVEDRFGVRYTGFTVGRSVSAFFSAGLKPKLFEFRAGLGPVVDLAGPGAGGTGGVKGMLNDSFTFGDLQNLTEGDKAAITGIIIDTVGIAAPSAITRFLKHQFARERSDLNPRRAGIGAAIAGIAEGEIFLGKARAGLEKNTDIPDGTGSAVIGGDLSMVAAGAFTITLGGDLNTLEQTINVGLKADLSASVGVMIGGAMRWAREQVATETEPDAKLTALDKFAGFFSGEDTAGGGLGVNGALAASLGGSFNLNNFLQGTTPTDAQSFLARSATFTFAEAAAFGYRPFGQTVTNAGAGSKYTYTFTATGKEFYKNVLTYAPFFQPLLAGSQRFALPEVSQPSGVIPITTKGIADSFGAFIAWALPGSQFSQDVEYGDGIDFDFGADGELASVGGGIFLTLKTNQTASYPVRRGVTRNNHFFVTETYPLRLTQPNAWATLQRVTRNYTDPIVLRYVTKGNITPKPSGGSVDIPNVAGLELASANDASLVDIAAAVPFTAENGPTAPASPDKMGLAGAAGNVHFGVNGFAQFSATNQPLSAPAHLTFRYSDDQVSPADELTLGLYRWSPSDGEGTWVLVPSTIDRSTNVVEADVTVIGTFTLAPRLPSGTISWSVLSIDRAGDAANPTTTTVLRSAPLFNNDGTPIGAGQVVHVRSLEPASAFTDERRDLGLVQTPDTDGLTDGVQLLTDVNGQVTVQIQVTGKPVSTLHIEAFTNVGIASSNQTVVLP